MEYPIIYMERESSSYKHCAKAIALLVKLEEKEMSINTDYLVAMQKRIQDSIASFNVVSQGMCLQVQDTYVSVYKGNLEKHGAIHFLSCLSKELQEYTNSQVDVQYAFCDVMLLKKGKTPSMFSAAKVGKPLTETPIAWQPVSLDKARNMGKYLQSIEEFQQTQEPKQYDYYI